MDGVGPMGCIKGKFHVLAFFFDAGRMPFCVNIFRTNEKKQRLLIK